MSYVYTTPLSYSYLDYPYYYSRYYDPLYVPSYSRYYSSYYDYVFAGKDYAGVGNDYAESGGVEVNLVDLQDSAAPPDPFYELLLPASSLPEPLFALQLVVQADVLVGFVENESHLMPPTEEPLLAIFVATLGIHTEQVVCLPDTA